MWLRLSSYRRFLQISTNCRSHSLNCSSFSLSPEQSSAISADGKCRRAGFLWTSANLDWSIIRFRTRLLVFLAQGGQLLVTSSKSSSLSSSESSFTVFSKHVWNTRCPNRRPRVSAHLCHLRSFSSNWYMNWISSSMVQYKENLKHSARLLIIALVTPIPRPSCGRTMNTKLTLLDGVLRSLIVSRNCCTWCFSTTRKMLKFKAFCCFSLSSFVPSSHLLLQGSSSRK